MPWGKGQSCPLGQGVAFHWRRLVFPTAFPFARTSLMKPARKLGPSGIRRRHGAMDDTTIQQEAAQRRPGRGQERRRASPPSSGRRSIDRTAARQQAARVKARVGSDRGATECREAPRGSRRRTEQRPVPASQARAGAGRTMRRALGDAAYTGADALFHRQGFRDDPDDAMGLSTNRIGRRCAARVRVVHSVVLGPKWTAPTGLVL